MTKPSRMRFQGEFHPEEVTSDLLGRAMITGRVIYLLHGNELVQGRVIGLELESGGQPDQKTPLWNVKLRTDSGDKLVFVRLAA